MSTKEIRKLLATNKHGPAFKLHLNKDTKRTTIAKAFFANETVKCMSIFVEGGFMNEVSPASLHNLFRAIGSLPLEELYIYSYGNNMDVFPVQLIGDVLRVAFKLEVLACYFLELGGGKISFDKFQDDLIEHPSLREVRFQDCQLSNRMLETHTIIDKFFEALSSLPKLEKLELTAPEKGYFGTVTPAYLEHLAGTTERLTSLNLINFVFDNEHISALNRALKTNRDLTELAISANPEFNSKLPALLATTKSLTDLTLQFDSIQDENFLLKICKGIGISRNISRFQLLQGDAPEYLSRKCQNAFAMLPQKNGNIERLDMSIEDKDWKETVDFWTEVNSDGTREMLENEHVTREEVLDALVFNRDDVAMLHYILSMQPGLVPAPVDLDEYSVYDS